MPGSRINPTSPALSGMGTWWRRRGRQAPGGEFPQESIDVLSDPEALADIRQAEAEVGRGEVVRGVDAVRALRSRA